ncbi:hypothetical protein C8E84_1337 [Ornithinibacter aureus]|nr:hypothetical protein C8E84_1337 [Ornithinibacter aureus]
MAPAIGMKPVGVAPIGVTPVGVTGVRSGVEMQGRSRAGHVVVDGTGLFADELVAQLRRCEVPVVGGAHAADGAELALAQGEPAPAAVVIVARDRPPRWAGTPWQARGTPHLPLVVGAGRVVVGPLVLPGSTACLRCCADAWGDASGGSSARTQGAARRPGADGIRPGHPASDTPSGTVVLACAVATVIVLTTLRGDVSLGGISTEIGLADVSLTHRLWNVRADCGCARVRMAG